MIRPHPFFKGEQAQADYWKLYTGMRQSYIHFVAAKYLSLASIFTVALAN
jgi:hypothetical protein